MAQEDLAKEYVAMATETLKILQQPHGITGKVHAINMAEFKHAAGFAFIVSSKGALGISVEKGEGFVVANLGKDGDGKPKFSAPMFVTLTKVGVGLQLGYTKMFTAMLFDKNEALEKISAGEVVFGRDFSLNEDPVPGGSTAEQRAGGTVAHGASTVEYSKIFTGADGFMVDVSINGGKLQPASSVNELMYHSYRHPVSILCGDAPVPLEFQDFYKQFYTAV